MGGLDEAEAGCIYDFTDGNEVVLVAFGGLIKEELIGFGVPGDSRPVTAPFEFFNTVAGIPVGKVFVRDLDQLFYQRGVRGLGGDATEVATAIKTLVSGSRRVVFVGQSAGGYAALLFGAMVGADQVIAFSPVTFLSRIARRRHHDDRWAEEVTEIRRLCRFRRCPLDLRRVLHRPTACSAFDIYFGNKNPLDRVHAGWLKDISGVQLHPWPTASHAVARRMREAGALTGVLLEALSEPET